ncbi:MAG: DUF4097 domain-containing protein [Acidobacteria bacterium]|nr:DUF4097 domain-containing protein [Acidobacteriota bacterium]
MKQKVGWTLGLVSALLLATAGLSGAQAGNISTTINTSDDEPMERCDQIKVRFGDRGNYLPTARSEQQLKVSRSEASPLILHLSEGAGMRIQAWDRDEYAILVCKIAGARSSEKAQQTLDGIKASMHDGRLSTSGPEGGNWLLYLIVNAPKNAEMELQTENGEIGLTGVSGSIRASSENGPIELTGCSQEVRATTQNGPISISGGSGDIRLKAENGPISVDLSGAGWKGAGLEARTENGPLSLKLTGKFKTGIRVEASGYSPMSCKAAECREAHKSWDDDLRWIEFNGTPRTVKLYTVNGPVSIESGSMEF